MASYTMTWVTSPDDPEIQPKLEAIWAQLADLSVISSSDQPLDHGLVQYRVVVGSDQRTDQRDQLKSLIGSISYEPVSLSLELGPVDRSDETGLAEELAGLRSIVQAVVGRILKTQIDYVDVVHYLDSDGPIVMMIPIGPKTERIYRRPEVIADLRSQVNLNALRGFTYLSDDPLMYYALSRHGTQYGLESLWDPGSGETPEPEKPDLRIVGGCFLIRNTTGALREAGRLLGSYVRRLRHEGYFTLPSQLDQIALFDYRSVIYRELAPMFQTEIITIPAGPFEPPRLGHLTTPLILKSRADFNVKPELFFERAAEAIVAGQLPRFWVKGWWRRSLTPLGDDQVTVTRMARIKAAALRAYAKVALKTTLLKGYLDQVRVLDDLTIEIPVTSSDDVEAFLQELPLAMAGFDQWRVIGLRDLSDGLIERWALAQHDDLTTLILDVPEGQVLVVITNRSSEIPTTDRAAAQVSLTNRLLQRSKDTLTLSELVSEHDPNQVRGLYDFEDAGLSGLLPSPMRDDQEISIKPADGFPLLSQIVDFPEAASPDYELSLVMGWVGQGGDDPLTVPIRVFSGEEGEKPDQLRAQIEERWFQGQLLNDWSRALSQHLGRVSAYRPLELNETR